MPKVLISDKMDPKAAEIFRSRGLEVDEKTGLSKEELAEIVGGYDGLAVRSSTKVTPKILEAAANLKVIGRAGIGVDNIDVPEASARGVALRPSVRNEQIHRCFPCCRFDPASAGARYYATARRKKSAAIWRGEFESSRRPATGLGRPMVIGPSEQHGTDRPFDCRVE